MGERARGSVGERVTLLPAGRLALRVPHSPPPAEHSSMKEAGTERHPEDELLKQEDFRTSWGIERLPPGWYRAEARRRWSSFSDGDVYDDDDRDSSNSYS